MFVILDVVVKEKLLITKFCSRRLWQNQSPPPEVQQDDRQDLQITLQEVIVMINMLINRGQKEMMQANGG